MKKKWLISLLALGCACSCAFGLAGCGAQGEKGDKGEPGVGIEKVEYDKDGNLVITLTDGSTQTVAMPEKETGGEETTQEGTPGLHYQRIAGKDEYRVIGLGMAAELDIVIPSVYNGLPVTEISEKAFDTETYGTANYIASVIIPDSVTSIGDWAFIGCSSLKEVVIGNGVTSIGNSAFYNCDSLTEVVIPDSVTSIEDSAFRSCDGLTEVVIPDSVTSIGAWAFEDCSSLTSVVIGNGVTSIGNGVFEDCSSLKEVVIGNGVTSIGGSAFSDCSSLRYTVEGNLKYLGNEKNPYLYLAGVTSTDIQSITIHTNCRIIGDYAFSDCSSLTEAVIPDSVTSIGNSAFRGCNSLTEVVIGNGVTSIGEGAFASCSSLAEAVIGNGVISIGYRAFSNCSRLTSITFKGTVEEWHAIAKGYDWHYGVPATEAVCSDGKAGL